MSGVADHGAEDRTDAGTSDGDLWQRLDKWLWCARFMKARADCARLVEGGMVRINRQPTDKAHARLRPGNILTLPLRGDVLVVRVLALAARRGPAAEARLLYEVLELPSGTPDEDRNGDVLGLRTG